MTKPPPLRGNKSPRRSGSKSNRGSILPYQPPKPGQKVRLSIEDRLASRAMQLANRKFEPARDKYRNKHDDDVYDRSLVLFARLLGQQPDSGLAILYGADAHDLLTRRIEDASDLEYLVADVDGFLGDQNALRKGHHTRLK